MSWRCSTATRKGEYKRARLREKWITRYKNTNSKSLLLGDAIGEQGDFEIEDLFPEDYYHKLANEAHKPKLDKVHEKKIPLVGGGLIVDRLTRGSEKIGIQFNKGSVAKVIRRDLSKLQDLSSLDPKMIGRFEKLFAAIESSLKKK